MTRTDERAPYAVQRTNRRELYLIIGSIIFVMVASTALFKAADSGLIDMPSLLGTSNNGVLIEPPQRIDELELRHPGGRPYDFDDESGAWTLLVPVTADCDDACARNIYLTRQARTALGRDMGKVNRLIVAAGEPGTALVERIAAEHPDATLLTAPTEGFATAFADSEPPLQPLRDNLYFAVDPYGWMMMYYTPEHDGHALLDDMKFLLKYSPDREKE